MTMDQKTSTYFENKEFPVVSYKIFLNLLEVACRLSDSMHDLLKKDINNISLSNYVFPLYNWNGISYHHNFLDLNEEKTKELLQYLRVNDASDFKQILNRNLNQKNVSNYVKSNVDEAYQIDNDICEQMKLIKGYESVKIKKPFVQRKSSMKIKTLEDELLQRSRVFMCSSLENFKLQTQVQGVDNKSKISILKKNDILNGKVKSLDESHVEHSIKNKLNDVIYEGLLDSVLPYIIPKDISDISILNKKSNISSDTKSIVHHGKSLSTSSISLRNCSLAAHSEEKPRLSEDVEVEIHVCDEVKNLKKDFKCSQKLLVSKMGYFAEVTTGQRLEDMDISVHCDIAIFDWLMRWVRKDFIPKDEWPKLDPTNVVPILISAAFLQMDPLLDNCLLYCHKNTNEILNRSSNLACLNDNVLSRLANMFSNSEVEALRDTKDKIQSRLYCKLIESLTSIIPCHKQGHYSSLSYVYKCTNCNQLVSKKLCGKISCISSHTRMDFYGNICTSHLRDTEWDINHYITSIFDDFKSWRKVYWHLWASCHYLYCNNCKTYFPVHRFHYCYHHKDTPQFFTMEHQRTIMSPTGRFSCCGQKAYRFEVIENQSGCQLKEHSPFLESESDWEIYNLVMKHRDLVIKLPAQSIRNMTKDSPKLHNGDLCWDGLELTPNEYKLGLFPKIWEIYLKEEEQHILSEFTLNKSTASPMKHMEQYLYKKTYFTNSEGFFFNSSTDEDSTESDSFLSEESHSSSAKYVNKLKRPLRLARDVKSNFNQPVMNKLHWDCKMSIRSNQDNQREYEQSTLQCMIGLLTRRTSTECSNIYDRVQGQSANCSCYHNNPLWNTHIPSGGSYIRLEQQWKEKSSFLHSSSNRQRCVGKVMFKSKNYYAK